MKTLLRLAAVLAPLTCFHAGPARALDRLAVPPGADSLEYFATYPGGSAGLPDAYRLRDVPAGGGDLVISAGGAIQNGASAPAGADPVARPAGGSLVLSGGIAASGGQTGSSAAVSLVPEPQAWLLFAAGLALLAGRRRRLAPHEPA